MKHLRRAGQGVDPRVFEIDVALFDRATDSTPKPSRIELGELIGPHIKLQDKKQCPAFAPATFRDGGRRLDEDVEALTAVVLDFDGVTASEWQQILEAAEPFAYGTHSTYSHGGTKNGRGDGCYRMILLLSRPLEPTEIKHVRLVIGDRLGHLDDWARTMNPSRIWFKPAAPPEKIAQAEGPSFHAGRLISVDEVLAAQVPEWFLEHQNKQPKIAETDRQRGDIQPREEAVSMSEVLRHYGIPHPLTKVHCTFPDHADADPSFRVDGDFWICTCGPDGTTTGGGTDKLIYRMEGGPRDYTDLTHWLAVWKIVESLGGKPPKGHPSLYLVARYIDDPPTPGDALVPRGWRVSDRGIMKRKKKKVEEGYDWEQISAAPILITKLLSDTHDGRERWQLVYPRNGRWKTIEIDRDLAQTARCIPELAAQGAPVHSQNSKHIVEFLSAFEAANLAVLPHRRVTSGLGWLPLKSGGGFQWGDETIGADAATFSPPLGGGGDASAFCTKGSAEDWSEVVAALRDHPIVLVAMVASIAAPLLLLLDVPSFSVDLSAPTSTGKTTALRLAASVWGDPEGLMSSWNFTRVWLERTAANREGIPLFLDDTKQAKREWEIGQVLYDFANERGRGRGNLKGTDQVSHWRTIMLMTGESPAIEFTRDAGTRGRVLTVHGRPFPPNSRQQVVALDRAISVNFGHAGPAFVEMILDRRSEWVEWQEKHAEFTQHLSQAGADIAGRLARYGAALHLANKLAGEEGIIPKFHCPVRLLWKKITEESQEADMPADALRAVVAWAQARATHFWGRHETIRTKEDERPLVPHQGWAGAWKYGASYAFVGLFPPLLENILREHGFHPPEILRAWGERGWLETGEGEHRARKVRVQGERSRLICIKQGPIEGVTGEATELKGDDLDDDE